MFKHFFQSIKKNIGLNRKHTGNITRRKVSIECNKISDRLKRMQHVFEYATDGLFFTDVLDDGRFRIVEINPAFKSISGVTEEQINLPFDESQDNGDGSIKFIVSKYRKAVATKKVVEYEITYNHHTTHTKLVPVPDENGRVVHVLGMSSDITQQKIHEKELFKRAQEFSTLVENSPDIIIRYDRNYRRLYANPAYLEFSGFTDAKDYNATLEQKTPLPANVAELLKGVLKQVFETGTPADKDLEWTDTQGRYKCFYLRAVPEFDKTGNIESVLIIARDITNRRQMEEALRKSEEQYRLIAENTADIITLYDLNFKPLFISPSVQKLLGFTVQEAMERSADQIFTPGSLQIVQKALAEQLALENDKNADPARTVTLVVEEYRKDGSTVWVEISAKFLRDSNYRPTGFTGITRDITERKGWEEFIDISESRYRSVFESANDGIFLHQIVERNGNIEFILYDVNQRGFEMMGNTYENIILGDFDLLTAGDPPYTLEEAARRNHLAAAGHPQVFDWQLKHKDGSKIWGEINLHRTRIGSDDYLLAVVRDITERKELKQRLKESLYFIENIINSIPEPVFVKDQQHRFIISNHAHSKFCGYTREELIGKTDFDFYPKDVAKKFSDHENLCFETGKEYLFEDVITNAEGEKRNLFVKKTVFNGLDGTKFIVGIINDVTKIKNTENQLKEAHIRLSTIFSTIPDLVWMKDIHGKYLACNKAFEDFFGATEVEIVGKTDHNFVDAELANFFRQKDMEAITVGTVCINEETITYAIDGRQGILETRKVPVFDHNGNTTGVLGIARDITERKRIEEANQHLSADLSATLQAIPDLLFEVDIKGTYFNFWTRELNGLSQQKDLLLGCTIFEVLTPQAAQIAYSAIEEAAKKGSSYGKVYHIDSPEGHKWYEISVSKKASFGNYEERFIVIARNITERKIAEEKLQKSQHSLTEAQRIGHTGSWELDFASGIISFSPEVNNIYELAPERTTSSYKHFFPLVHPDDREFVDNLFEDSITNHTPCVLEHRLLLPDGRMKYLFQHCETYYDNNGSPTHTIGTVQDITERKLAQEALVASEQKVRKKLESVLSPDIDFGELELSDIVDIEKLKVLIDDFCKISNISIGIIDTSGKAIVKGNWQDICTKFHRAHPESCKLCIENDVELLQNIAPGTFKQFHCKNNMWNIATPIVIGGRHMGNIFVGQFLYNDEIPDKETFIRQTDQYGFNEKEYMAALEMVPRVDHRKMDAILSFLGTFAGVISNLSYSNLKLANSLEVRKQMEIELRKKQASLEEAQRIGKSGSWELDLVTNKLEWSAGVFRIFEIDPEKFESSFEAFLETTHPDDRQLVNSTYLESVKNKIPYDVDHRLLLSDGRIKYVSEHGITYYDNEGNPLRSVGTVRDMTHRKEAELELLKAKEKAEESNRLKSAFLATMNHELRTPLNAILGFSELLKSDTGRVIEFADIIHNSGKHLLEIIESILDLAIASQSQIKLRKRSFNLDNMFTESKQVLEEILKNSGKNTDIDLVLNPDIEILSETVYADHAKINQVLGNLFRNAIKFTDKGSIEYGLFSEKPGWLTYYISDTGIGVPMDKQPVIFDFFRQGDDSNTRRHDGIGIGLAISKKITEVLNGTLTFDSKPGYGSTFYFSIPVETAGIDKPDHSTGKRAVYVSG